ncbi:Mycothiol maleylpyruvate isomerase N-terminal domain-containing protein [Lentzea fradiae]|uniref:Mycothiol maleylpyruvate isomerase N-terminal domain-containing protein n=1 Tax=Lentzea fradiae TaxID=200378 RepID=A0A1G7RBF4_9PSEU|nr:maleylpyruvate isomerase N-terminal domain-containing protein [Lentzea fradiae]SDG07965.1 Mycothiol maleylpyruvate isomerase N-terminal domain-containing protein [Lentzea fradiae]
MDLFPLALGTLLGAVGELTDDDFDRPSGCEGWLVRDLVCHLVTDAQDVLITLVTPTADPVTHDEVTYWRVSHAPADDPLSALTVRLAAAYGEPWLLKHHVDDVGQAALRAAELADPTLKVSTGDMVLCTSGYLGAYVWEWTLHHLDLVAHLPHLEGPPPRALARCRQTLERIAGPFPSGFSDVDVLLVGTGRRAATERERAELGDLEIPFVLG